MVVVVYRTRMLLAFVLLQCLPSPAHPQQTGAYPSVASVATYRPVAANSVCGANGPEQYCQFTTDTSVSPSLGLLPSCDEATCDNTCPHSATSPAAFHPAAVGTLGPGVTRVPGRSGGENTAFLFESSSIEVAADQVPVLSENGFSFATWINRSSSSRGTLLSKSSPDSDSIERNYVVSVEEDRLIFDYLPNTLDLSSLSEDAQRYRTVIIDGLSLPAGVWHHIAVTVYAEDAAVYVNGTVEGVQALEGQMVDTNRTLLLGTASDGIGSYSGLMEEMYLYTQALTEREVQELFEGSLPFNHLSTECHCPPSHPVINLDDETQCIQHTGANLISRGTSDRINPLAHPPGFVNDLSITNNNGWISSPGDQQANITLNLTNSLYELIFINIRFGSPRFKAAILETSRDGGKTFHPIQYFADDCMAYFNLPNDGEITEADAVNCITSESLQTPTFGVDVRTRLLDQQRRPFNLNDSPELRRFILSSHLQLQLVDLFTDDTTQQHQYYNLLEITVAARCACNGHSSRCGNRIDSVCECAHNTEGDTCDRCLPLYNDKPWRYGETSNAYPCKVCDCNGHADSCHYNTSVDPFPLSYDQGGGGVCDNCQRNTAGDHCESCTFAYYRPSSVSPNDSTPCVPCACDTQGVTDNGDCVKSEGIPGEVVGQCQCKTNVVGRTCDECEDGFFDLSASNPQGCSPCDCNTDGTVMASISCHATSGQCTCKPNVMGLKCDQCMNGTTQLSAISEEGCSDCFCDVTGSLSSICDPQTGDCDCKPGVGGNDCDECLDGYFGFSETGCEPCICDEDGATSNTCDKGTGVCMCRPNVEGDICDTCSSGYYNLSASCIECGCNTNGTVESNVTCHEETGQCVCKENVEGRTCDMCKSGFTRLTASDIVGCTECNCSDVGTDERGSVCDPITSQCECLPSATGYRCESCVDGYYITEEGCMDCECDPDGSSSSVCDIESGDCPCNTGVGGEQCNICISGFFQFPSCTPCNCNSTGSIDGDECNVTSGECNCKRFVTGDTCNECLSGYQQLDLSNPFGCSAAPDEQGPPTASLISSTSIGLTWFPPESPNGVILGYRLYRNGSNIANTTATIYNDTGLTPNTYYSYSIESYNIISSTTSTQRVFRTLEAMPTGLSPPTYGDINSTAVNVSWTEPAVSHGTISHYILLLDGEEVFRGLALSYVVTDLRPYTNYSFVIQACTSGGCGSSESSQVQTAQAPPTSQPAPTISVQSDSQLHIQWAAPTEPNGIIIQYDVFQREAPFQGDGVLIGTVDSSTFSLVAEGLQPFTVYQFSVESYTEVEGTQSEWSEGRSGEAAPSGVNPPNVTALSSNLLEVTWTEPTTPNGIVISYTLFSASDGGDAAAFLTNTSLPGSFVVDGLDPYTEYGFVVEVCTNAGCTNSSEGTGFTGESGVLDGMYVLNRCIAIVGGTYQHSMNVYIRHIHYDFNGKQQCVTTSAPTGQSAPVLSNITATSIDLSWEAPEQPNGNIITYTVHRRTPSLLPIPAQNDVGVSFTGNGHATFVPMNPSSFTNELSFQFRTLDCCGIIFYSINTAESDMIAIELRDGVPWFVFDAGSGPGAVKPEGNTTFNDGSWHTLTASQTGNIGTITVDSIYTGSGSSPGTTTVVAYNRFYVGGIPSDAPLQTTNGDSNPLAALSGLRFSGCLHDVTFNGVMLDFSSGFPGVGIPGQGCPVDLVTTAQLLGGGYFSLEESTITGNNFNISFQFRTTHSDGLLLFMYGDDDSLFGIELLNSNIHLVLSNITDVRIGTTEPLCNVEWHRIVIFQEGQQLYFNVDGTSREFSLPHSSIVFSSRIFFGGVPLDSNAFDLTQSAGLNAYTPFSGCIRMPNPLLYVAGQPILERITESELVNFDGCGNAPGESCMQPWSEMDAMSQRSFSDTDLHPFSAYLYRIVAMNTAGSAYSSWQSTSTQQSAPSGVGSVSLTASTSSSLSLTWGSPATPNGLITQYYIQATPITSVEDHTGSSAIVTITEPEQSLEATLDNLLPFTTYYITLSASTVAGTGSGPAINLTTGESVPMGVQPAYVMKFGSRFLVLFWDPPTQPNGNITEYRLYVDGELRFSGLEMSATINGLLPSTSYAFLLEACTRVGCSNSSESRNTTLPDKPGSLAPPSVTPLTPTSLEITWEEPTEPNGDIIRYELQQLDSDRNITLFEGNNSFFYTLSGLTPNTLYSFRVLATNAGGTTASEVAQNRTLEDAPDGLNPPQLTVINATTINIVWEEPLEPNGVITEYILYRNGSEIFSGLLFAFNDTSLEPFTFYSYFIMACTSGNCSASTSVLERTGEAPPEELQLPSISSITSYTFDFTVNEVLKPNGIVSYVVTIVGSFASSPNGTVEERELFNSTEVGTVTVTDLLPFTYYQVDLTVSNSAGSLTGEPVRVMTNPAAPEGLRPPILSLLNATTLEVSWSAPEQANDNITQYELLISNTTSTSIVLDQGLNTSAVVYNLRPFTNYTVRVTVYNSVGSTSAEDSITTGETEPSGFDDVSVEEIGPRSILLSWDEPAFPNGILINYTVLQDEEQIVDVSPPSTVYNVTGLQPYTNYQFSVLACTAAGCAENPPVDIMTMEDVPEDVPAPFVSSGMPGQVFMSWLAPTQPNGVILYYIIERAQEDEYYIELANVTADGPLVFGDVSVEPYTEYSYRIVAVNSAGSATGPPQSLLTPEAAPEGVLPPILTVLSSSAIQVAFQPPTTPNGEIISYSLTRHTFNISLNVSALDTFNRSFIYEDTSLSPYTNYTYFLTACTSAGCSYSNVVWTVTDEAMPTGLSAPLTSTISESSIFITWDIPTEPNGIVQSYDVFQQSFSFEVPIDVATLPNCCEEYLNANRTVLSGNCRKVVQVDADNLNYTVSGLQPYSNYRYCLIVTNGAGATFSPTSNVTQTSAALMPISGPILNATTVNSTAIYLSWSSLDVSQLLGPFSGYSLYRRLAGHEGYGEVIYMGNDQEFTTTNLVASTEYTFTVSVSNGRGFAFGNNASAITEEGIPANLSAPQVRPLSATSIYILWTEPNQPNGVIISYTLFLNSEELYNQSMAGSLIVDDLSPFTLYTVRVEACTQFGCTLSPQVQVTTFESAPVGLPSPLVQITGPTSANVSWLPPMDANGIITNYQLFQRQGVSGEPTLVLSNLTFQYTTTNLRPFTTYGFEVYAINGGGNVSSGLTTATTDEAPPTFVDPPSVSVISATMIRLLWTEPEELNGVLIGYNAYRNRNGIQLFNELSITEYTDLNLEPFTQYTYIIEACTNAGCTQSSSVSNMTLPALPEMVSNPVVENLQARSLVVSWQAPGQPNGIISQYLLYQVFNDGNTTILSDNVNLMYSLSDLTPFTEYSFYVDTCNSVGCTSSATVSATTLQAPPEGVSAPMLRDLTSTSAHIEWLPPIIANGIITNYTVRRSTFSTEPVVVFEGIALSYDDMGLVPNTLYSYTVTAINDGGSTESAPSYIETIADLAILGPLSVEVLGSTSVSVTWGPPILPNGDISLYILYMDDVAVFAGIGFEYLRDDLTPYTEYTFYYEVVNQAGTAGSPEITVRTDASSPEGLDPPELTVLGATAIRVAWQPPSAPNGEISEYRVRRRLFENPPTEFIHFVTQDVSTLVFQNSGLEPFTTYEYRVEVFNQAGSALSDFSNARTAEDIPEGVVAPTILSSNIFARNLTATWSAPSQPNGVITGYRLEYRLLLDPATSLPGETVVAAETPNTVTSATALNLIPVTTYEFRVAAINSAGDGFSDWEVVTTAEDVPEGITSIIVESRTASSLTLSWGLPANPNGVIREYLVLLNGVLEHQTDLTTYRVTRLQPFTTYSLQLAACTSAGCTNGTVQFATTDEATPVGLPAPSVTPLSARRVEISWNPPSQPNGIIELYEIFRQEDGLVPIIILSTSDTVNRAYVDSSVFPATMYGYAIAANNSAGRVMSEYRTLTTPEAAPEGISEPAVIVISSTSIEVSWAPPIQPNGVISQYQLFRGGGEILNESVYIGQDRQFTDSDLAPFTVYTYTLQACTQGGCDFSDSISNTTLEALPENFDSVQAIALTAMSIRVEWMEPLSPNGIIVRYELVISDGASSIAIVTSDLNTDVTNLQPYTQYTITIDACNSIGCVSGIAMVTTLESIPQFIAPPTLLALSPTSVNVQWQEPAQPNGEIVLYILRRDGLTTFEGNTLAYNDTNLLPNRQYSYTVQAFTAVGGSEQSLPHSILTPSDTPEDISPPTLTVLGADSIMAEWVEPGQPNGEIQSYILSVNGTVVFEGRSTFVFMAGELNPFTVYEFRLDVCTTTCGNSSLVREQTREAMPTGQAPPTLQTPFQNTTVLVSWLPPAQPNGIIISYQVRRRLVSDINYVVVYSGLDLEFYDIGVEVELRPAMVYEYQVTSTNSIGSVTSDPNTILLPDAAPEGLQRPQISDITSTTLTVTADPPAIPNGELISYQLYRNGSKILEVVPTSQDSSVEFNVDELQPHTVYAFGVEVCTSGGCGLSESVTIRTSEDVPSGYDSVPVGVALSARSILVSWSPPSQPNGIITSYTLWYRLACPQPDQPQLPSSTVCMEGPLIQVASTDQTQYTVTGSATTDPFPYSQYQFLVQAQNSVGAVNTSVSDPVLTAASDPEVKGGVEFVSNQTTGVINLNWMSAFRFNGVVQRFTLTRNGIALLSRPTTSVLLSNEPRGTDLTYVVTILTDIGEASTDPLTLRLQEATGSTEIPTVTTGGPSDDRSPFYEEAAFIIGMVILGVCVLFLAGAVLLCFVRPHGDPGFLTSPRSISTHLDTPNKPNDTMNLTVQSHGTRAGSWSPGQPIWEDLPDLGDEGPVVTPRKQKSYSPRREEKERLLEEEVLPDTHIAGYASGSMLRQAPHYTTSAEEDFGTFRASQTTFADTKV